MKFLISLALVAAAVVSIFWYVKPAWAEISQTKAQIDQYETAITQAQSAVAKKNDLTSKYNSFTDSELSSLQAFLPASIDQISFISSINTLALTYGKGLDNVSIGLATPPSAGQSYGILPVSFTVSMTYSSFLLFLKSLEQSLPPTDVTALSFSSPSEGTTYTFNVTVQTYYLP